MNFSDYLKLVLAIFFIVVAVGVPMYLVWLVFNATGTAEKILLLVVLIAWILFLPWRLPIEDWIGDFVKKYRAD